MFTTSIISNNTREPEFKVSKLTWQHIQLSQILNNLILPSAGDMVNINKTTLADIQVHLQHAHEMIEFLQLESQLQRDGLQQKSDVSKYFIHTDEDKDVASKSLNNINIVVDSKSPIQPTSSVEEVPDPVQLSSKPIIKPWEELQSNKNRRGLGYIIDDANLHIPDYSRPIKFVSVGFLAQITLVILRKLTTNRNTHKLKL